MYAFETFYFLQFVAALQAWIIGVRYWLSATSSSLTQQKTWINQQRVMFMGIAVGATYLFV
jgi:hypothetical protein